MSIMDSETDDFPSAAECFYTSHYCEENIWKLCELIRQKQNNSLNNCYCVFVSNDSRITPLWHQKVGSGDDFFVAWDYHVFLVYRSRLAISVYDFDTTLGFPVSIRDYIEKSIGLEINMIPKYRRYFRVIPASEYLKYFSSDRRHMKNADGGWLKPPPPYEPIQSNDQLGKPGNIGVITIINGLTKQKSKYNLDEFISMKLDEGPGVVMDLAGFIDFFQET